MSDLYPRAALYRDRSGTLIRHIIRAELRPQPGGSHLTIHHEPEPEPVLELTIAGEEWPATAGGNADRRYSDALSYGQNDDDLADAVHRRAIIERRPDQDPHGIDLTQADAARVSDLWRRWHLNAMRALCAHQTPRRWTCTKTGRPILATERQPYDCPDCGRPRWTCDTPCYAPAGSHPYRPAPAIGPQPIPRRAVRLVCADCAQPAASPTHGYRAGSAWLVEPLPADVLDTIRALFGPRP